THTCNIDAVHITQRTTLAPVYRHVRLAVLEAFLLPQVFAIENRVGLRAILGTELTARRGADINVDIGNKIHAGLLLMLGISGGQPQRQPDRRPSSPQPSLQRPSRVPQRSPNRP